MKVLDLFSGIGGFAIGLERAGMETVAFCEIEEFPRKVLAKHWPGIPIHDDIKELDGEQYRGTVDVVCGGFPCQPFSHAGKRGGKDDDRALWPEMLRVIREVQPTWVIGENVVGLESLGLAECVSGLESSGFAVQVFDIPACGVGAPHKRHRLWIVAHAQRPERGPLRITREDRVAGNAGELGSDDSDPCSVRFKGRDDSGSGARHSIGWDRRPTQSPVCRGTDGISFGLDENRGQRVNRLRALGNAVIPQIPEIIGRAIMETEHE